MRVDLLPHPTTTKTNLSIFMSQTYQPKKRKRSKTHGFLVRMGSANGKKVIARRRTKGRAKLAV